MLFILKYSKKTIVFFIIYICIDILFFSLLPKNLKSEIYNNRAHRIKSYYYHHDLRPMASFYDSWGYERYKIFTNNLGFKDSSNREVQFKNRNILFIGDSFTEGVGLKYEDTYVGIIDKELRSKNIDLEVLNAGVQSYSTSIYLSKIYHLLNRKKLPISDIVIMVSGGDIFDDKYKYLEIDDNFVLNHEDRKTKFMINLINFYKSNTLTYQFISRVTPPKVIPTIIKQFFDDKDNLEYDKEETERLKIKNDEIDNLEFFKIKDYSYFFSEKEFNIWGKKGIDYSINNLKKISEICKKKNINLNILYLYEAILVLKSPNEKITKYLINKFKELEDENTNIEFINDYHKSFENQYEAYKQLFFIKDIHFNKKGNQYIAKEILNKLNF